MNASITGHCDRAFAAVRAAFGENFSEHAEIGAGVAVYVSGRCVVDLVGGFADRAAERAWTDDTLVNVYSATKGLAAICVARLVDTGQLDLDARVADYWPEFGAAGKAEIRVHELLGHRAGLAALTPQLPHTALYEQATMAAVLAAETPHWPPGAAHGYHALTFGFLLAELVRRCAGVSLGQYLREQIALPLSAAVHVGFGPELDAHVAKVTRRLGEVTPAGEVDLMRVWKEEPDSLTTRAFNNPAPQPGAVNTRAYRAAELPSSNGHASALGLCRPYAALANGGSLDAVRILSPAGVARCSEEYAVGSDLVLRIPTRFGPGFMLSQAQGSGRFGPNARSFGHPGMGGSIGFADPDARLGFGYVMNRAGANILVGDRPRRLIEAAYACI